jgi:hypothetical protein
MGLESSGSKTGDGGEDLVGSFLPVRGLGILVVRADKILNGVNEGTDAGMTAPLDLALGKQSKQRSIWLSQEA